MRYDNLGMFWEDVQTSGRGEKRIRSMPPIPDTGWTAPTEFPNLSTADAISIDCETYDPELLDNGPGWARGKGHIVGVAVGASGGGRWYFPIRHEIEPETNMHPETVMRWLGDTLRDKRQPKVGANLTYDVGWLNWEGVAVAGELVDVQFAEALLAECALVNLETMSQKYLGEGKATSLLYQWCADFYGGAVTPRQRANIYRAPPRLVGPYAEGDADLPLRLTPLLYKELATNGLLPVFNMECGLIRLLIAMRMKGVRVDNSRAEVLQGELIGEQALLQAKLNTLVGFDVTVTEPDSLARAFDSQGLPYSKTPTGRPSFTKKFMADAKNPIADIINDIRKLEKLRGTFIESYVIGSHIDGRVHGQFHQLRNDEGGTRSGRLAASCPNLQNIPIRDPVIAQKIRGLFLPDYGHKQWVKYDYSQIEYRFLIHFAVGAGADEARELFNREPDTDYHDMTMDMVAPIAGWDVSTPARRSQQRRPIKNINFGLIFGMGEDKLAADLNLSKKEGKELFKFYHKAVPFARKTMGACTEEIEQTGVIRTILGRKSYFDLWEPLGWGHDRATCPPLPYREALLAYDNIKRAESHKGLNRKLQGSAADLLKLGMLTAFNNGVFDYIGVPLLTVHDELDFSDPGGVDSGFAELKRILETVIPLRIPVKADVEVGPDWGHVK